MAAKMRVIGLLAILAINGFGASIASASAMGFATDFGPNSNLYSVDFGTNTASLVGATGFSNVTGLSFQPGTGTLFGVDHATDQLITINTSTGAGTAVGSLGVDVFDVGIAFDGAGNLYMSNDSGPGAIYSVNPVTGAAAFVGNSGTSGVVGLDFDLSGQLFGLVDTPDNNLVTINTATGAATLVGSLGFSTNTGGIAFDDGSLFGAFGFVNPGLTVIDPLTGSAATPTDLGITFSGLAIESVPEPSILALLGIGLAGVGFARRRMNRGECNA